jgi:hypothetical protein
MTFRKLELLPSSGDGRKIPTLLGNLGRAKLNHWSFSHHLRTETVPVAETSCFLLFRIQDDGQSPNTKWFWVSYKIARTLEILPRWRFRGTAPNTVSVSLLYHFAFHPSVRISYFCFPVFSCNFLIHIFCFLYNFLYFQECSLLECDTVWVF